MPRFARASKKTSLEATPWHQLANSGGDHTCISKTGNKTVSEDNHHSDGKKTKMADKKRKNSNVNDEGVKTKKAKKSEHKKDHSEAGEDGSNGRTGLKKKNWEKAFKSKKDNHRIIKKTRLGAQKNTEKNKRKSTVNANRTETWDKKHEARRKRRAKGKVCFHCRQTGHLVSECPLAQNTEMGVGNCYKCGSSEHTTKNCSKSSDTEISFPFAKCFICGETGHIARACPDNPKGLYPNGGGCKMCGSVEHFRRDCPELKQQSKGLSTTTHAQNMKNKKGHYSADAELEDDGGTSHRAPKKKGPFVVKF